VFVVVNEKVFYPVRKRKTVFFIKPFAFGNITGSDKHGFVFSNVSIKRIYDF